MNLNKIVLVLNASIAPWTVSECCNSHWGGLSSMKLWSSRCFLDIELVFYYCDFESKAKISFLTAQLILNLYCKIQSLMWMHLLCSENNEIAQHLKLRSNWNTNYEFHMKSWRYSENIWVIWKEFEDENSKFDSWLIHIQGEFKELL